jgi:hypothetical protein
VVDIAVIHKTILHNVKIFFIVEKRKQKRPLWIVEKYIQKLNKYYQNIYSHNSCFTLHGELNLIFLYNVHEQLVQQLCMLVHLGSAHVI